MPITRGNVSNFNRFPRVIAIFRYSSQWKIYSSNILRIKADGHKRPLRLITRQSLEPFTHRWHLEDKFREQIAVFTHRWYLKTLSRKHTGRWPIESVMTVPRPSVSNSAILLTEYGFKVTTISKSPSNYSPNNVFSNGQSKESYIDERSQVDFTKGRQ